MATKSNAKTSTWVIGTVVLALGILVLAWFVAIGPQLDAAATARAEAEATRGQNAIQAQRLATLREQFEQLDDYKAELADIRTQIPTEPEMPALLRELDVAASEAGVTILSVSPGTPEVFFAADQLDAVEAPVAATVEETDGDDAEGDETEASPTAQEPAGVDGFIAVPFELTVIGGYENVTAYVSAVQTGLARLFMVTGFQVDGQEEAEASGGRPATAQGDGEMVIRGYVYVLQESGRTGTGGSVGEGTQPEDAADEESVTT